MKKRIPERDQGYTYKIVAHKKMHNTLMKITDHAEKSEGMGRNTCKWKTTLQIEHKDGKLD